MIKVMLAVIAATLVSVSGGVALADHSPPPNNKNDDKHYLMDQCKNGGWQDMGYKNQGQCVSHFAKGGS